MLPYFPFPGGGKKWLLVLFGMCCFAQLALTQVPTGRQPQPASGDNLSQIQLRQIEQRVARERRLAQARPFQPILDRKGCTNGDFETGDFSSNSWQGGYGSVSFPGGILIEPLAAGLLSGAIGQSNAHHTIVPAGDDPLIAALQTTPSNGGAYAVRIGNAVAGRGAEMLTKTFVVAPDRPVITFDYAVVLEDPTNNHALEALPTFRVRVYDVTAGAYLSGVIDLDGSGNNFVRSNNSDFFRDGPGNLVYSVWQCASIDLSDKTGHQVTVEFITEDCGRGGHFAYAYLDNFCSGCGDVPYSLAIDLQASSSCGPGRFCADFQYPANGSAQLQLEIKKPDGSVVLTKQSPPFSGADHGSYCFELSPNENTQLAAAGPEVTVLIIGSFTAGTTPLPQQVAAISQYRVVCPPFCCGGRNLVSNGDFAQPQPVGTTEFVYTNDLSPGAVTPGKYAILTGQQTEGISNSWFDIYDKQACLPDAGAFLVVNGQTGGCGITTARMAAEIPQERLIWEQEFTVNPWAQYRFCFAAKKLYQLGFDVTPKLKIRFPGSNIAEEELLVTDLPGPCNWHEYVKNITPWGAFGTFKIQIWLDQCDNGDGNDLALDNLYFAELPVCPPAAAAFELATANGNGTSYQVQVDATILPGPCQKIYWSVCEWDVDADACVPNTEVAGLYADLVHAFPGYNGSGTPSGNQPGAFSYGKFYRIMRGTWGDCQGWTQQDMYVAKGGPAANAIQVDGATFRANKAQLLRQLRSPARGR